MRSLLFLAIFCGFLACQDSETAAKDGFQETPSAKRIKTSELIKNPATASGKTNLENLAKIEFEETEYEFGEIKEGAVVNHSYKFKNVGDYPLMITSARSTCGCTIPKFPREPIEPGAGGEISVRFNSEGKLGSQLKPITITANTYPADTKIFIKGSVVKRSDP